MSLSHDPELPAGCQDADLLQADLEAAGRHIARLQAQGICTHGWTVGLPDNGKIIYPEQEGLTGGQRRCMEQHDREGGCRQVFDSEEDWHAAMGEVLA
jgi:hypothetical protein